MVEDKWVGKTKGAGPSGRYDIGSESKKNDGGPTDLREKDKGKFQSFQLSSEIEKSTVLRKVLEQRILESRM